MALGLGRFAQDMAFWTSFEVGQLRFSDGYVQISSIMPQKRNPVPVEHLRLMASLCAGKCEAVLTALHNTPFTDMNDNEHEVHGQGYEAFAMAERVLTPAAGSGVLRDDRRGPGTGQHREVLRDHHGGRGHDRAGGGAAVLRRAPRRRRTRQGPRRERRDARHRALRHLRPMLRRRDRPRPAPRRGRLPARGDARALRRRADAAGRPGPGRHGAKPGDLRG